MTETGRVRADVADDSGLSAALLLNRCVRAVGFCRTACSSDGREVLGILLVPGRREITLAEPSSTMNGLPQTNAAGLPFLVSAAQVHRLKREEAERKYPVKIRGVITSVLHEHQAFTLPNTVSITGTVFTLTLPLSNKSGFYRLRSP